jgi:hypothetical protein
MTQNKKHYKNIADLAPKAAFVFAISLPFAPKQTFVLPKTALYFCQSMGTQNGNFKNFC